MRSKAFEVSMSLLVQTSIEYRSDWTFELICRGETWPKLQLHLGLGRKRPAGQLRQQNRALPLRLMMQLRISLQSEGPLKVHDSKCNFVYVLQWSLRASCIVCTSLALAIGDVQLGHPGVLYSLSIWRQYSVGLSRVLAVS